MVCFYITTNTKMQEYRLIYNLYFQKNVLLK